MKAIMLVKKRVGRRLEIPGRDNLLFMANARTLRTPNSRIDESHVLNMFLAWLFIDEKEGASAPNASFVVAADPTIRPTSPIKSIIAG